MDNKNLGFAIVNGDAADMPEKTILVLGIGRGGTSMMAGVLSKLGIYMGEELTSRYQDSTLLDCIKRNDKKRAKKIILERNQSHSVWGIKKLRLWRWDNLFRKPVYVVIFRDLVATANRHATLFNVPLLPEMIKMFGQQFLLLLFVRLTKRPLFIASYEKALLYPEDLVPGLAAFLGLDHSREAVAEAIRFISPSPAGYTDSPINYRTAQQTRDQVGYIDRIEAGAISGWALSTKESKPVGLALFIDGKYQQTLTANLARPDVAAADSRFHENCGFVFRLADTRLQGGERIDVRFADTDKGLLNSPRTY